MTTIKITELTNIGANLATSTVIPVVNMAGTPTTEKTVLGNIANVVLAGAGGNYVAAAKATIANTVTTNAQPNITSTGNLIGLTVSNANGVVNFTTTANVTLGAVSNLHITGGTTDQLLTTDGTGNLSWTTVSGGNGTPSGSNTQIQFNDAGAFGGNTGFTFDKTTGILAAPFADVSGVANIVGGGATVATKSVLNVASTFGSNDANDPASAQAVRGRVTGANLTKTRNYVTGVTGQYLVTGTNASEFIKAGILGVVGDQTTTADGAVVAYLDGDGGLTTANAAYAVSMKNSTPNSGFNYGLDLQFISLNLGGVTTSTFKQADIRFNNGVTLVANTANNISINANVTVGNIIATNIGNISNINLTGSNSNVLYGNGVFAAVTGGGANTGNVTFNDINIIGTGNLNLQPNSATGESLDIYLTAADDIHIAGSGNIILGTDEQANVAVLTNGNVAIQAGNVSGTQTWNFGTDGNLTLPRGGVVYETNIPDGGLNGNTIALAPSGGTNVDQQLLIYPTTNDANHLHLTSGNLYSTELFLGDDNLYVKLANTGNIVINSNDDAGNTAQWTFGTDGALTLPIGVSIDYNGNVQYPKIIADSGKLFSVQGQGNTGSAALAWTVDPNAASQYAAVSVSRGGGDDLAKVVLTAQANSGDSANAKTWQFSETGNLTLPGNLVIAGNANVFGTNRALIQPADDLPLIALSSGANGAVSSVWVEDIGNVGTSNIAAVYANPTSGSGIVRIVVGQNGVGSGPNLWDFNANGTLTFPGTPRIDTSTNNFEVQAAEAINFEANTVVNIYTDTGNNAFQWQFGDDGNLTLPGDIVGSANANFTIYSNAAAHEFIFADDGTFYAPDNVVLGGDSIYIGPGANTLAGIEHEVFIASSNHFAYVQGVINNVSDNGSADWVALGAKGDDTGGQATMGFTSSGFGDANYTITGGGDGYLFTQSYALGSLAPFAGGGNLVLATGNQGTTKDIIFGTGGFLTSNIFGRISHANNSLELSRSGATITFPDATEQNTAWTGSVTTIANGNSNVNIATSNGNIVITSAGTNSWNFDSTGNLTIPGSSGGFIKTVANASIGIVAVDNGTNNPAQLLSMTNAGAATSIISAYATNATIQTNATGTLNTWQFDNAGNLTLPTGGQIIVSGGLVSSGASPAPTINGFSITNSVGISGNGNIAGNNISATGNITANNFIGNGNTLSNVATKTSGSWTLASGVNTVNINVPLNGTYAIWVNGNIPNGIITYTATAVVTNTNVPVLGEQYAWYYALGNALVLTSIPNQFTGTVGSISTVNSYAGNTANVFTFGITNNSGNTAVVNYGYTKL